MRAHKTWTLAMAAGFGLLATGLARPAAAETRGFVFNWVHLATYAHEANCPQGLNLATNGLYRRILKDLNYPPEEIELLMEGGVLSPTPRAKNKEGKTATQIGTMRGTIDGKPANAYVYPLSVPDPKLLTVEGRYAYGFDLDGQGAESAGSFEDPETHERGVDNELFRAVGCFQVYNTRLPDRPIYEQSMWGFVRDTMPAWLVTITGDDLSKDGDVTVTFDRALRHPKNDVKGNVLADQTYVVSPDPRSHHVVAGKIKNGVVTLDGFSLSLMADVTFVPEFRLDRARMRLSLNADRTADGFIGGYTPWIIYWNIYGQQPTVTETSVGIDVPGLYHLMKRLADADPDPVSGENRSISASFRIELVPAFVLTEGQGKAARVQNSDASQRSAAR